MLHPLRSKHHLGGKARRGEDCQVIQEGEHPDARAWEAQRGSSASERFLEFADQVKNAKNAPPAPVAAAPPLKINKSTPEQQRDFLRSLKCKVTCEAEHIKPEAAGAKVDVCRMDVTCEAKIVADKIIAGQTPTPSEVLGYFNTELKKRICFLDGGMGTRIQAEKLEEEDERLARTLMMEAK